MNSQVFSSKRGWKQRKTPRVPLSIGGIHLRVRLRIAPPFIEVCKSCRLRKCTGLAGPLPSTGDGPKRSPRPQPQRGCGQAAGTPTRCRRCPAATTPLGLRTPTPPIPRVVPAVQPWALLHNRVAVEAVRCIQARVGSPTIARMALLLRSLYLLVHESAESYRISERHCA